MKLAQLRDKANALLGPFWTALVAKQDAYYAKHGKYFQLLVTPNTAVVDGVDSDFTANHPSDEKHVIDVDFAFADKIPFNIEVNEWVGVGDDKGFSALVTVQLPNGDIYKRMRSRNVAHAVTDTDWYKYEPVTI